MLILPNRTSFLFGHLSLCLSTILAPSFLNNDCHYLLWPILVVVTPVSARADMRAVLLCVGLVTLGVDVIEAGPCLGAAAL